MSKPTPLPVIPNFPVYGLDDTFHGPRWQDTWNQARGVGRGPLWQVGLGHGDRLHGPLLVVVTDANLPLHEPDDGGPWRYGPTGASDVAMSVLLHMVHAAYPADQSGRRGEPFRMAVDELDAIANRLSGPEWSRDGLKVDEVEVPSWFRGDNRRWVTVADLGSVSVGLYGNGIDLKECGLISVNSRLDEYIDLREDSKP